VSVYELFERPSYDNIVFFSDFPVITANFFITNGISITLKYNFVRGLIKTKLLIYFQQTLIEISARPWSQKQRQGYFVNIK